MWILLLEEERNSSLNIILVDPNLSILIAITLKYKYIFAKKYVDD